MRNLSRAVALVSAAALFTGGAMAQFGLRSGSWNTAGADAQRTAWARADPSISLARMPEFQFLWKVKVDNTAKGGYSLSQAVTVDGYVGYRGFRSYAFVGGASNAAIALDFDIGRVEWTQTFGSNASAGTAQCPGGMTGGVTRPVALAPAPPGSGAQGGRGGRGGAAATGSVGEPDAGAPAIALARPAGRGAPPPGPPAARGPRPGPNPLNSGIFALATDGKLRTLYISNGKDIKPPMPFLPADANASGLMLVDNVVYAATRGNCGGAPNGVWAMDISAPTPTPVHWSSNGGGVVGTVGPALGTDATIYAATGDGDYTPAAFSDSLVALETKTLRLKDWFTPGKSEFTSSPVVFPFKQGDKERDLIAVANKDGHLYLLDSASLGGADHKTPLARSAAFATSVAGALASWEVDGERWILVSAAGALNPSAGLPATNGSVSSGAVVAFKVVDQGGKLSLQPGWVSRDLTAPLPPIVVNGLVFALSGGTAAKAAVLYALDGKTGKELWNSGTTIAGQVLPTGGMSESASQLYLATADSTIYAFGIPIVPPALAAK